MIWYVSVRREGAGAAVKLIVGLGNPGMRYVGTRHNVGFDTVDLLARRLGWAWTGKRSRALLAERVHNGEKTILAKPQTYMNDSGLAVGELVRFYKLELTSLLVVCDDLDLPLGKVRMRARGASGGQHGLESIIQHLGGATGFPRVKIGIGRPEHGRDQNIDFLLSRPTLDDRIELDRACERAADAILSALDDGIEAAMNRFNGSDSDGSGGNGTGESGAGDGKRARAQSAGVRAHTSRNDASGPSGAAPGPSGAGGLPEAPEPAGTA
jgi:PTH1 family peptidyl-tRNA hydrolase